MNRRDLFRLSAGAIAATSLPAASSPAEAPTPFPRYQFIIEGRPLHELPPVEDWPSNVIVERDPVFGNITGVLMREPFPRADGSWVVRNL